VGAAAKPVCRSPPLRWSSSETAELRRLILTPLRHCSQRCYLPGMSVGLLTSRSEAPRRKARKQALLFGSRSSLGSSRQTATAGNGSVGVAGLLFESLRAFPAQFLYPSTDCGKVVGSAGSVHVPSPQTCLSPGWLERFLRLGGGSAGADQPSQPRAPTGREASENHGWESRSYAPDCGLVMSLH
jgi:hypothetical protein